MSGSLNEKRAVLSLTFSKAFDAVSDITLVARLGYKANAGEKLITLSGSKGNSQEFEGQPVASYSEVVLGSQYWGQYYLAISSTIWMMGWSTLIRLADDTRLIQLLFRRTSTRRKGLIET